MCLSPRVANENDAARGYIVSQSVCVNGLVMKCSIYTYFINGIEVF